MDIEKFERFEYVSFDIFDTVILRNVGRPCDIFDYVGIRLEKEGIHITDFKGKRIAAECKAINGLKESEEVSFEAIYSHFEELKPTGKQQASGFEVDAEISFCCPNEEIIDIIKQLKRRGKSILLATDMYLPKNVIEKILSKCAVPYDYLFVSSEIGLRKSTGRLFHHIIHYLKIQKKSLIHVGDNLRSDYLAPKFLGISSIWYRRKLQKSRLINESNLFARTLLAMKANKKNTNPYYDVGYKCLGALLVGFCDWLREDCKKKNIDNLLFFSRDGYVIQKAFHILYPELETSYVYISRRSVTVPQLIYAKNWSDVIKIVAYIKREETWTTLFHKLGIEEHTHIIKELNAIYGEVIAKEQLMSEDFAPLFNQLSPMIYSNAIKEMEEAKKYLNPFFKGKVAIVDIGWYGTMQHILRTFYKDSEVDINGYYIGILEKEGYENDNVQGYIYDYLHPNQFNEKLIYGFNGLIESFFTANHGSTKKYIDGKPILEEWESKNWSTICPIHDGALQFCKDILPYMKSYGLKISKKDAYSSLLRLMVKPTKEDIRLFGKLEFFDAYCEPLVKWRSWGGVF